MHSSSRVRSLAVLSPLALALAALSAQAATHVNLHQQDASHLYKQYRAASAESSSAERRTSGRPALASER